jgi:hypothetical protein
MRKGLRPFRVNRGEPDDFHPQAGRRMKRKTKPPRNRSLLVAVFVVLAVLLLLARLMNFAHGRH